MDKIGLWCYADGFFLNPECSGNISSVPYFILQNMETFLLYTHIFCPDYEDVYGVEHGVTITTRHSR